MTYYVHFTQDLGNKSEITDSKIPDRFQEKSLRLFPYTHPLLVLNPKQLAAASLT
jgi:hypothetical protein